MRPGSRPPSRLDPTCIGARIGTTSSLACLLVGKAFGRRGREPWGILVGNMRCDTCGGRMYLVGGAGGVGRRYICGMNHGAVGEEDSSGDRGGSEGEVHVWVPRNSDHSVTTLDLYSDHMVMLNGLKGAMEPVERPGHPPSGVRTYSPCSCCPPEELRHWGTPSLRLRSRSPSARSA